MWKNVLYALGFTSMTGLTLGKIMLDNYLHNSKRNRQRWLDNNPSDHVNAPMLRYELLQIEEWKNMSLCMKMEFFRLKKTRESRKRMCRVRR